MPQEEIIYFELNNWIPGDYYPNKEPFTIWIDGDYKCYLYDEDWVKENRLCVAMSIIDMSVNFCITALKAWVEKNCPQLLMEYAKFLRIPEKDGWVYGQFGDRFLEYREGNFGIKYIT